MTQWNLGGEGGNAFPFDNPGDFVQGTVLDLAEVQQTDLQSGQPAFWDDGKPKMMYRVTLQTELRDPANPADDGKRTVYLRGAKKPKDDGGKSSLCAVLEAVKATTGSGNLAYGGKLTLQYSGDGPATNRGFNPPKYYQAWYEPPAMVLEQPAEHKAPPAPPAAPQFGSPADNGGQPAPQWATGAPAAAPGAPPAAAPPAQPQIPGTAPAPAAAPPAAAAPAAAPAWGQQAAAPVAPPAAPAPAAAPAGPVITRESVASLQAAGVDPTTVYGPGWEQRITG